MLPELMAASDLLITKPGGLTTAEALAAGLPMILTHPIPGPGGPARSLFSPKGSGAARGRVERHPASDFAAAFLPRRTWGNAAPGP